MLEYFECPHCECKINEKIIADIFLENQGKMLWNEEYQDFEFPCPLCSKAIYVEVDKKPVFILRGTRNE